MFSNEGINCSKNANPSFNVIVLLLSGDVLVALVFLLAHRVKPLSQFIVIFKELERLVEEDMRDAVNRTDLLFNSKFPTKI